MLIAVRRDVRREAPRLVLFEAHCHDLRRDVVPLPLVSDRGRPLDWRRLGGERLAGGASINCLLSPSRTAQDQGKGSSVALATTSGAEGLTDGHCNRLAPCRSRLPEAVSYASSFAETETWIRLLSPIRRRH